MKGAAGRFGRLGIQVVTDWLTVNCQKKENKEETCCFFRFCLLFSSRRVGTKKQQYNIFATLLAKWQLYFLCLFKDSLGPFKPTSFCIFCNVHQICIERLKISVLCIKLHKGTRIISELPQCIYAIVQWHPQPPVYLSSKPLTPAFSNLLHFHSSDGINDTRWRHSLKIKM